jgi:hypothetical protein
VKRGIGEWENEGLLLSVSPVLRFADSILGPSPLPRDIPDSLTSPFVLEPLLFAFLVGFLHVTDVDVVTSFAVPKYADSRDRRRKESR